MTIIEAVTQVMAAAGRPMTPRDVLSEIQRGNLYAFKTQDPLAVIRAQMRRHCQGYARPIAASKPRLTKAGADVYALLDSAKASGTSR
jgi:restriction system protein